METIIERTTRDDQRIARQSITHIEQLNHELNSAKGHGIKIQIQETGEFLQVPKKAIVLLLAILSQMAEGKSITIIPSDSEVSTQHAADMLNVSRPHLVKLLESQAIPYRKVGSHRRILLKDVFAYYDHLGKTREKQLRFLAEQAQKLNMGYE